ncbi:MAG: tRNA (N(6)-L-threonylcarbamoyladenosine(37)-C(2))-methylthiotransferase [Sulfolobales archaeon]
MSISYRVYVETYGCTLNKADSMIMASEIEKAGGIVTSNIDEADVILINTCIVRRETEERMILRLKELRTKYVPDKRIIVAGCMASALPATVREIIPEASIISTHGIYRVNEALNSKKPVYIGLSKDLRESREINLPKKFLLENKEDLSIPIPITQGCMSDCSFCITKYARPVLKSYEPKTIKRAVEEAVNLGYKEIELTAQDTAVYGFDLEKRFLLPDLLRELVDIEGDFMIRVGMMNPQWLNKIIDDLIEIYRDPKIFKFVHIPIQSGDDRVLRIMKRGYSVQEFIDYVKGFRKKIPDINIATDIIVGHPGEDEEAFENTIKLLEELKFDRVHIAQYSIRPFTEAASMPQVDENTKKKRSTILQKIQEKIGSEINRSFVNKRVKTIVVKRGYRGRGYIGRSISYRTVVIDNIDQSYLGKWVYVNISDATYFDLRGCVSTD